MKSRQIIFFLTIFITACSVKPEWYLLKSNELDFEILFPSQPKFSIQTSILETGKQDFDIYYCDSTADSDDNINYFASRTEYTGVLKKLYESNPDLYFDNKIRNSTASVHGKIIALKVKNYKNYPGREVRIDFKNGETVILMRMYLVRNKAYVLETMSYASKDYNSSQTKFFESFKLIE